MNETNEKTKFDTTRPFMAIIPDEVEGSQFTPTHGVYLVNPLDAPLSNVLERIGGFFSDDDGVIEAQPNVERFPDIAPRSALQLEMTSLDEFYEFVCWWSISYTVNGETHRATFDAGKALSDTEWIDVCPVLNRRALLVSR